MNCKHPFPSKLVALLCVAITGSPCPDAQVAVNGDGAAADPSAMLDVAATNRGVLLPRLSSAQRDGIPGPATGLIVYVTDLGLFQFWNGTQWVSLAPPDADGSAMNELQTLSRTGTTVSLSQGGGSVDIADGDSDPNNELQYLSRNGTTVSLTKNGGSVSIEDADADPQNELQTLSVNGSIVTLSQGGGSFDVNDGDNDPTNELDSPWNVNGNNIYFTGGQVGINLANPSYDLEVNGTVRIRGGNPATGKVLLADNAGGGAQWGYPAVPNFSTWNSAEYNSGRASGWSRTGSTLSITGVESGDRILVMVSFRCSLKGNGSGSDDYTFRVDFFNPGGSEVVNSNTTGLIETIDQHRAQWLHFSFQRVITSNFTGDGSVRISVNRDDSDDALYLDDINIISLNLR